MFFGWKKVRALEPVQPQPAVNVADIRVFRAENFPVSETVPWLDQPDWRERVAERRRKGEISKAEATLCTQWAEHGYVIMRGLFAPKQLDAAWAEYEAAISSGAVRPTDDHGIEQDGERLPGRLLNPHFHIPAFDALLRDRKADDLVSLLLGAKCVPFQTISGHRGSQQAAHSDSIHMTTYPQGYLVANWIAFEDINPDSGPLEYYPGSHRLPYSYSQECDIGLDEGRANYRAYHAKYEPHVARVIAGNGLVPHFFDARKGDVLFWHANLLHGGSKIANLKRSRKALVCHFFAEGCVCYHDYTGTPSHLVRFPLLTPEQFSAEDYVRLNPDVGESGADPYTHYVEFGFKEGRPVR